MLVYVLLFNAHTDNEGLYAEKLGDHNVVFMFENEDDATRFGLMLEAQDFPPVTIEAFEVEEIEAFCAGAGYGCKLVPEGTLTLPHEQTVEQTDWDPDATDNPAMATATSEETDGSLSQAELDQLRQRLEKLL